MTQEELESKERPVDSADSDFFEVDVPSVVSGDNEDINIEKGTTEEANKGACGEDGEWHKVKGWYNELNFYSRVFQHFGESIRETESQLGWYIILISSFASFVTLLTLEPFSINVTHQNFYNWGKSVGMSVLTVTTTLIASWMKKKNYVGRMQAIDKRVARLEKFLGKLDYQSRLVPLSKRDKYYDFITQHKDEYNSLAIYTSLIRPKEFSYVVYKITRYHAPSVTGLWPWYDTVTNKPRPGFAKNIIETYERQFSFCVWFGSLLPCSRKSSIENH
jgi:heme exporter protein D